MPNDKDRYQEHLTLGVVKDLDAQLPEVGLVGPDPKSSLIDYYMGLREKRYEAVCYLVGLDMYTSSKGACRYAGDDTAMNRYMWSACEGVPETVVARDSVARCAPLIMGSSSRRTLTSMKGFSCAITGATNVHVICDKMDFIDKANMCPFVEDGSPYRGANAFERDPLARPYKGSGRFDRLILSGQIGPGDRVSFPNGNSSETGYHERTLVSVDKDENGRITGYTVQANNSLEFSHHRIPDSNDNLNGQDVIYASTSHFAQDQFRREREMLTGMSISEIMGKIEAEQKATAEIIISIVDKERCLDSLGEGYKKDPKFAAQYPSAYMSYDDFLNHQQDRRTFEIMSEDFNRSRRYMVENFSRATGQNPFSFNPTQDRGRNNGRGGGRD